MESILWNWQVTFLQKKKKLVYLHLQFEDSPLGFFFFFIKGKGKGKSEVIKKGKSVDETWWHSCVNHTKNTTALKINVKDLVASSSEVQTVTKSRADC